MSLKEQIRQTILQAGFDACGFTGVSQLPDNQQFFFKNWLTNGCHADMRYMENNFEKKMHPALLVENAKSIIVMAINYFPKQLQQQEICIAKYAYGDDYHEVIKEKLRHIVEHIPELKRSKNLRIFTDSAPLPERFLAVKAGLGFIGKNNSLIIPNKGSFFFLAEIITDVVFPPDKPFEKQLCGRCERCINACPTKALAAPFFLDARKCISYLTIESKEENNLFLQTDTQKWIFGCDICLDACPWNRFATPCSEPAFTPNDAILKMTENDWLSIEKKDFQSFFKKSPLQRAGFEKIKRNVENVKRMP